MKQLFLLMLMSVTACQSTEVTVNRESDEGSTAGLSWAEFKEQAYQEPSSGVFIADGDTMFEDEKQLREFYEKNVQYGQLAVNRVGSADDIWTNDRKLNITYCINADFAERKNRVIEGMAAAAAAWSAVANVRFVYVPSEDANCTSTNNNVIFDVRPIANSGFLARAFFPSTTRSARNVVIDDTCFTDPTVSFVGILRHELGHALGFRHEHTRPEAGRCFEDDKWRGVTEYDSASVMHYPQCNGTGSFLSMVITDKDAQGAASLYGAPTGGGTDGGMGGTDGGTNQTVEETFDSNVAQGAEVPFGPFDVAPDSVLKVTMTGTGDADLYVRVQSAPTSTLYDCRPYTSHSNEECNLNIGSFQNKAYVMVRGYTAANIHLVVKYVKASSGGTDAGTKEKLQTYEGTVGLNEFRQLGSVPVTPGTNFVVRLTTEGTSDLDLYVKFGSPPSFTSYDCRPYRNGGNELCYGVVPAGAKMLHTAVHGFHNGKYNVSVTYTPP